MPGQSENQLRDFAVQSATALEVPGVAVGVYIAGESHFTFHGITSVENPLQVEASTLFQFGSTGKTYTATAIMRLVDQGQVKLDEPVRTYLPELKLKDDEVARNVTVLHLLNHTAGWAGDLLEPTGDGDDTLERYVGLMADLDQVSPLGKEFSYNNASLSLAGRLISKVTGKVYERAIAELIFKPLGQDHSFFFMNDIITRRFSVGHNQQHDGKITVSRPWALPRSGNPAGGISSNAGDLITWARFHLGDGTNLSGERILSQELLDLMKQPTIDSPGSAVGDQVGISWLLRKIDGAQIVAHGGTTLGQHSAFLMVPEKHFAISTLTNCGPNGAQFNETVVAWAMEAYCGLIDKLPEPMTLSAKDLEQFTGVYETIAAQAIISAKDGGLIVDVKIDPAVLAKLVDEGSEPPDSPPISIGMLPGEGDRYIVTDGAGKGMKGYFVRDEKGEVKGIQVGGRLATRKDR